jgi:hypothetical protein
MEGLEATAVEQTEGTVACTGGQSDETFAEPGFRGVAQSVTYRMTLGLLRILACLAVQ